MSTRVRLRHTSRYTYDRPVILGPHSVRLRPAGHVPATINDYMLQVTPRASFVHWQTDSVNNFVARVVVPGAVDLLQFDIEFEALLNSFNPFDFFVDECAEAYPISYQQRTDLLPYLQVTEPGPRSLEFVRSVGLEAGTVATLVALNQQVYGAIRYKVRNEPGVHGCEETLLLAEGSCRDMAWLLIQTLRQLGFAARCVAGYLVQLESPGSTNSGLKEIEQDSVDYHAWVEVFLPGAGWIGMDPTSGMFAGTSHIAVAVGPTPEHTVAVAGTHSEAVQSFQHVLSIHRVDRQDIHKSTLLDTEPQKCQTAP